MSLHSSNAWKRDMASRLGLSVEDFNKELTRVIVEDQGKESARSTVDKDGKIVSLIRFPGGYRRVH